MGFQSNLNYLLLSRLTCIIFTQCSVQFTWNCIIPFLARAEVKFTNSLFYRGIFVTVTLMHNLYNLGCYRKTCSQSIIIFKKKSSCSA